MTLTLTTTQKVTIHAQPIDRLGRPAVITGVPTWTVSPPEIASVTVSANGLDVTIAGMAVGTGQLTVYLGSITRSIDLVVATADAVDFELTAGPVEEQ